MTNPRQNTSTGFDSYLSPAAAWALAVGTSVGWGSLVVTSSTYLAKAGPAGSILGLIAGTVIMLIMCRNFHYLAVRYPDNGGVYTYTKNVFGYDRAFLVFWFLSLTYLAMFWANATSLPLFARFFLGDTFRFVYLFTVFGYEVYLGEALLTFAVIALITLLCIRSKLATAHLMVGLVLVFVIGITVCFIAAIAGHGRSGMSYSPAFLSDSSAITQTLGITLISPWAFIGFENITHSAEEFRFSTSRLFRILVLSVITTTALYIFVTLLSVTAYPEECESWFDYISRLGEFQGIDGLPAFYAANHYLGSFGVVLLMISLLALILTSLIGNLRAVSRLYCAAAKDDILPARFARLNDRHVPAQAMLLTAAFCIPIPFLGRTAIGWIVDITTIGATLVYGFVSAGAYKVARQESDRKETVTGMIGLVLVIVFGIFLLFPTLFSAETLETETYVLLIIWTVVGFVFFRHIVSRDHARRFGKAIIVWISLLALVVLLSMVWTGRVEEQATNETIYAIQSYYNGTADAATLAMSEDAFIAGQIASLHRTNTITMLVVIGLFVLALAALLINHFSMRRWEAQTARERDKARTAAYRDPLTGVRSKQAYVEQEQELDLQIGQGDAGEFGLVVCDVNGLKHINDTLGHKAGDNYILAASTLICGIFEHSPVYRIGGDEFVVFLRGRDYDRREELLAEMDTTVEGNISAGDVVISQGLSIFRPEEDRTFHEVFMRADKRMYERKQQLKALGARVRE